MSPWLAGSACVICKCPLPFAPSDSHAKGPPMLHLRRHVIRRSSIAGCAALALVARTLHGAQTAAPGAAAKTAVAISVTACDCTVGMLGSTIPAGKIGEPV